MTDTSSTALAAAGAVIDKALGSLATTEHLNRVEALVLNLINAYNTNVEDFAEKINSNSQKTEAALKGLGKPVSLTVIKPTPAPKHVEKLKA